MINIIFFSSNSCRECENTKYDIELCKKKSVKITNGREYLKKEYTYNDCKKTKKKNRTVSVFEVSRDEFKPEISLSTLGKTVNV